MSRCTSVWPARPGSSKLRPRSIRDPSWQETGIHGIHRPREWDATVTADAPDVEGDSFRFVALPDGTLLVEEGPESSLEPLAAAVEQAVPAAVPRTGDAPERDASGRFRRGASR